ncbi:hypothetical protein QFC19_004994 [Naganishia cerealis]|uniref:Uncharacterized protein n=1 Tax=Naganishia cerealis TaxID=610337 RepID=A0ACC2VS42_9TREE|nr:hypothetical protein QFC19_004994 [Naganishia cerealis]
MYKDIVGINGDRRVLEPFHPTFTYPIFGDKEAIFGYKGLKVRIDMASGSMKEYLSITYREKINSTATPADDIEGILYKFIPSDYTKNAKTFSDTVQKDADSFVPPGEKIAAYIPIDQDIGSETVEYGIYKMPGSFYLYLRHESGPALEAPAIISWDTFQRIRSGATQIIFGYVSAQLYNALWDHVSTRPEVSELTIEDPSEHFEDLRDRNDLMRLRKLVGQSKEILAGAPVDKVWMEKTRKQLKYAKRQFLRMIELLLLEQLKYKQDDPEAYRALRLQVKELIKVEDRPGADAKERLYRFNYEVLSQVEPDERKQKLQETYANVEEDYKRLLTSTRSGIEGSTGGTGRWKWISAV